MAERLRVEDSDDSIGACTHESVVPSVDGAPKSSADLDVHPLAQLPLLGEHVEMAVSSQSIGKRVGTRDSHKDLAFNFGEVG